MIPASLKKQISNISEGFVLKRSVFETCVELWPMAEWELMMVKINKLNRFVRKNDLFVRKFMAGVKTVEIDDAGRFLLSKDLIDFAKISKDVVFSSKVNVIEIWDKQLYEDILNDDLDFGDLAEEVMGNLDDNGE